MASPTANKALKNTNQDPPPPPPPPHHPLKCPRCDSSNTKFCYYNNYSLSQPRHFCKACKRYWTRGGTLRNVPVGGGCRKNKRPRRHSSSGGGGASSAASTATAPPQMGLSPASNSMNNSLFCSLPNFPFSSYSSTRVSSDTTGIDLYSQMNGLGLGFSENEVINNDYKNGFKPIQDSSTFSPASNNSDNNSIFFGSSNLVSTSTMASLLASSLHQNKFCDIQDSKDVPGQRQYEDLGKEVELERQNGSVWNPTPNPIEQINFSDPSSLLWNTTNLGAWFDPSNMGSSVPSLI